MSWVGRGMEDVSGKPFGWAFMMERREIMAILKARDDGTLRGARRSWQGHRGMGLEWHINRIQDRLHRHRPSLRERQLKLGVKRPNPVPQFTIEELALIAERFAGANDPVGQAIERKAAGYVP